MQQPPHGYGAPPPSQGYGPQGPPPGWVPYGPPPKKKRGCLLPLLGAFGALLGIALIISKCDKSLKPMPAAAADTAPSGATSALPTGAASASPTSEGPDEAGTARRSGPFLVTLKESAIQGKNARLTFLLKNERDKEAAVSSVMMFQATAADGEVSRAETDGQCDGTAPPNGPFKCKLVFQFEKPPNEVTVRVGATLRADDAVYFKVKLGTK